MRKEMTLDEAQDDFEHTPNLITAANYLRQLKQYERDDMIGDDTFHNGLEDIQTYLDRVAGITPRRGSRNYLG